MAVDKVGFTEVGGLSRISNASSLTNPQGNLILSSSVGSTVALSAALEFTNTGKAAHINAINNNLVLSNSAGSVVAFSASADYVNSDKNYHIRALNSGLILSSSVSSIIGVSGSIRIASGTLNINSGGILVQGGGPAYTARYTAGNGTLVSFGNEGSNYFSVVTNAAPFIHIDAGNLGFLNGAQTYDTFGNLFSRGSFIFTPAAGTSARIVVAVATGSIYSVESNLILSSSASGSVVAFSASVDFPNVDKNYHINARNSSLILSSTAGSTVGFSASADFLNTDRAYHVRALNSHLILSSSTSSIIAMSGALKVHRQTLASFPAGPDDNLSGSLLWDTTSKQLYVYGPAGWVQLASGSNTV